MKKIFLMGMALVLALCACGQTTQQPEATAAVPSASEPDLQATVESSVQQTLEAFPTPTPLPTSTVAFSTPTPTATKPTSTQTQNSALLTLTATLSTPAATTGTPGASASSVTVNPAFTPTAVGTLHYQYYGTMPPRLPSSRITITNKSKSEAYISLQCTTSEGYETIIEYPVPGRVEANFPIGKYVYVAWVGGRKITGKFSLDRNHDLVINIFKDHLEIK